MKVYPLLFLLLSIINVKAQQLTETTTIIAYPNASLPIQKANNNLDVVAFNNQYLLWRLELLLVILRLKKQG
jgi:hypothetical protein